jgi:DNA-binding CsgD family transcriptional regulator
VLIGRREELEELKLLLQQVRGGLGGAVVLRGEAGIGKTALLNALIDTAGDLSVLRLEGAESEMQLGYAALHRLVRPYLRRLEHLPEPQRDALQSAFGLTSLAPADRFMVGLATLSLLGDVAKDEPLLVIIDDAQWLDHESVASFVFVARRLHADQIALVFAIRDSFEAGAVFQGVPELMISGLGEEAARDLLSASTSDPISYQVAGRIIAATRGNPLALKELSGELTAEHLIEHAPLPDPLPIGDLIEARFLRQVRLLPDDSQMLLLAAAADPQGDRDTLWRASEVLGLSATAIEPAADSGLLALGPRIEFRHPLVRSAVYGGATAADRRRVHHALAEVMSAETDPDRKAFHLASGALGPDEDLASALEKSAAQARARGGYVAESSFLVRSASLTPDAHVKAGRLLLAAQAAFLAGNAGYSESLLGQARPLLTGTFETAQAQRLDGHLRYPLGQPHLAPSLLLAAAKAFGPVDPVLSHHSLIDAIQACGVSLELTEGTSGFEIGQAALESLAAQKGADAPADVLLEAFAFRYCEGYVTAVPAMRKAVRVHGSMSFEDINRWNYLAAILAIELWDEEENRNTLARLENSARATGALPALEVALAGLATIDRRAGRFNEARERYAELHDVALAIGEFVDVLDLFDVELLCWQGDERARAKATQLMEGGAAFCYTTLVYSANLSLSTLELAEGRYEAALAAALLVTRGGGLGWSSEALPIVVEAAVRCGDTASAMYALECMVERATASGTPWALGLLARCRALVADGSDAADLYEEALNHLGQTSLRTEVARTHLVYGEWLRRQKRRTEARDQLRRAYEIFDAMGARPFAERARVELLATGERARARRVETAHDLTSRELQIARLAAERATSREIAGHLFISANTVDYHLRKVFQKLGVTSRRDLAGVLVEVDGRSE